MKITFCDRCKQKINFCGDERIHDLIASKFPEMDLCPDCFNQIELAGIVGERAALKGISREKYLKQLMERYG